MTKKIFALDADGVLLNYKAAFPGVFLKAFGRPLPLVRPDAYHATTAYGLTLEPGTAEHDQFFSHFGVEDWSAMPLMPGVLAACGALHDAGYELVCVTSMPTRFEAARLANFRLHGLPIDREPQALASSGTRTSRLRRRPCLQLPRFRPGNSQGPHRLWQFRLA